METKKILKDNISYILTSNIVDDSYDLEVRYNTKELLLVYHITNNGDVEIHFGNLMNYYIDVELLKEVTQEAVVRLRKEQREWLDNLKDFE